MKKLFLALLSLTVFAGTGYCITNWWNTEQIENQEHIVISTITHIGDGKRVYVGSGTVTLTNTCNTKDVVITSGNLTGITNKVSVMVSSGECNVNLNNNRVITDSVTVSNPFIPINPASTVTVNGITAKITVMISSGECNVNLNNNRVIVDSVTVTNVDKCNTKDVVISSGANITANITGSSVSVINKSLVEFDLLVSTFETISANETNGIIVFNPTFYVKDISVLSEGGNNTITSTIGNFNNISDGLPVSVTLPRIVNSPTFNWSLTAGTTLHILVVGGK